MSLMRRMWLMVLGTTVASLVGAGWVNLQAGRSYIEKQLTLKNRDDANVLAISLTQLKGDMASVRGLMAAQFDGGHYRALELLDTNGQTLVKLENRSPINDAPAWFVERARIRPVEGSAQVGSGWVVLGSLRVQSHEGFAYRELWEGTRDSSIWLAVIGLLAGALGASILGGVRRPLLATVEQANALVRRQFITVPEPQLPELKRLTRAMNMMVGRVRQIFDEHSAQVESLRQQANTDLLTGLPHRKQVLAQLDVQLEADDAASFGAVALLRLRDLGEVNRVLGRRETDKLLVKLALSLTEFCLAHQRCFAGRLNGSDFMLVLPGDESPETLRVLFQTLQGACASFGDTPVFCMGVVAYQRPCTLAQVLSQADSALARAEAGPGWRFEYLGHQGTREDSLGQEAWARRLQETLQAGHVQLAEFPVRDAQGELLHRECPLRLQWDGGEWQPASVWLPYATRTGLVSSLDLAAVARAVAAIEQDGVARSVNLASASLEDSGFVTRLRTLLEGHPVAAQHLWLEIDEYFAVKHPGLLRDVCDALRKLKVKLGLEHAGHELAKIEHLFELGLHFIKLDASVARGVSEDPAVQNFVKAAITLVHGLGLFLYVEGVRDEKDARTLWALGIDGLTGPVLRH